MYNGSISPPSRKGLGVVSNFADWLAVQPPDTQMEVGASRGAYPSDMVPAGGVNPNAPYYGMPSSGIDLSNIPINTIIGVGIGIMVLSVMLQRR